MMDRPIILIGPMGAGKTTIASLLAQKLGILHHELDARRWDYYLELGYDEAYATQIRATKGFATLYQYWKPFEIHAVERILAEYPDGVISFGAGHSVYEDEALFTRAQRALAPFKHVILLLPSADPDEAAAILKARFFEVGKVEGFTPSPQTLAMIDHFISHPSNRRLAKHVIITDGQSPEQTCDTIIRLLAADSP